MNPINSNSPSSQAIAINGSERWDIYHRLQELGIPCKCTTCQLLSVEVSNPNELIQVWTVVKRMSSSRKNLIQLLNSCWEKSSVH
jgi:hypothetical protein